MLRWVRYESGKDLNDVTDGMRYSDLLEEPVELRPDSRLALSEHVARELLRLIDIASGSPGESLPSQSELAHDSHQSTNRPRGAAVADGDGGRADHQRQARCRPAAVD